MVVYPWNGIRSSAQGLAIARAVEEKYGPAKEVIFPRVRLSVMLLARAQLYHPIAHLIPLLTGHRQCHCLPTILLACL